ncbi:helix-turn-helix domain-containing protein [Streptomyces hirsutus]|uniref:helix-turn-helix domain-containing protein n=1 Tax=Streptomyces hirsutus TaxID=35620 RepID=UPI00099E6855|nr:helix-turn-helix transcriptional regulator [Streptomyces hirsutus]
MPPRPLEIGPAGQVAARAIERLRAARGYSQRQLSARVTALGRPMTFTQLSRVERQVWRCDIDDLVAIATALGTPRTPSLVMPASLRRRSRRGQHSRRSPVGQTGDPPDH